jgi:2-dehydropantoate 2-reductase
LTLQNGLGNLEALARALGEERVLGGTTAHGAYLLGVGHVRHAGSGPTIVGEPCRGARPCAPSPRTGEMAELFRAAGIEAEATDNLAQAIWDKLVMNCGVNPVAAICRLRNGQLAQNPWSLKLMQSAALEAAEVAAAQGISLSYPDPAQRVKQVCEATAPNINSMLQDILVGRRTEIEAINGAVAELGRRLRVETPVNEALAAAVRAIEQEMARQVSPAAMAASEGDSARGRQVGPQDIA